MGTIHAKNDLPNSGDQSRKVNFRTKISWASDPDTGFLAPGSIGNMKSEHIEKGKDFTVEAQVKISVHRDMHISIDNVKENQTVIARYDGDQYVLERIV